MVRRILPFLALIVLVLTAPLDGAAQQPLDAAQLRLAVRKLTVLGSALHVAAHPDDENTALLAYLANDRLYRTGYLSMTRGDGGQNLLGDEKGELLGVIRTQELLAARRIDGAEQFFTRAIDFGFTKSPVETLEIWGHDAILADTVWIIRRFQPDVVISRFPTTGEGGHGQHTASAILAVEAFKAAGDATKFPEQLRYVRIWQPKRLFMNRMSWVKLKPEEVAGDLALDLGKYDPLLGRSYTEIATQSRNMHKSQGFGVANARVGTSVNYFRLLDGAEAKGDLFEGIDTTWGRYPGGEEVGRILQQAYEQFDGSNPTKVIPLLLDALTAMQRLGAQPAWENTINPWLEIKREEVQNVIRACAGISIDVSAAQSTVSPGNEIPVSVTVVNRSDYPFTLSTVASPWANPGKAPGVRLENNVPVKTEVSIRIPANADYSQPYWLTKPPARGAFTVADQQLVGLAENPAPFPITVSIETGMTHALIFTLPMVFHWTDAVRGEQTRRVDIVPEATVNPSTPVLLFPDAKPRPLTVWMSNLGVKTAASLRLLLPGGWTADPVSKGILLGTADDQTRVTFMLTPPKTEAIGRVAAQVELTDGRKLTLGMTNIDYPHIPAQRVFGDAMAKLVRVDVKKVGDRVGYVMGSGDDVPAALRQMGYEVTLLTDADLERGDFARYDAIVAGVRAYNTRRVLKSAHERLMQYVEHGGTMVVQYNSLFPQPLLVDPPGPFPFKVTNNRVTVEEAPVRFVDAAHPLLNKPNKITPADFADWVQERGLYFTENSDPRYATVLASNDPGEPERAGGELYTRYGKGVFIYTSYAWFRQLPAGVPGAYKLFANMVSAR